VIGSRALVALAWPAGDETVFAPLVAVAATSTSTSTSTSRLGGLALRWQAVAGSVCPLALRIGADASLRPCAAVELGSLRGEGVAVRNAERHDATWVALGVSGRFDVAVWAKLLLVFEAGASSPFTRSRFAFSSGESAFETPALGGRVGLTLAFRL